VFRGGKPDYPATFFACALNFAHRFFVALPILALAEADSTRFFTTFSSFPAESPKAFAAARTIHVRSSVYAGTLGTPKSDASIASLPMPPVLATRLKTFLASKHYRQNGQRLLFANRRGRPFAANKLREKKLRPPLLLLGISLAGFHAFRHGVATTLIDRGASITTVGAQLRHNDPRITLGCMHMLCRNLSARPWMDWLNC
jgi:hypothetical protein